MRIFIGSFWNEYTDEWEVDADAIFLKEEDAKAWMEESQKQAVQRAVDRRNKDERDAYERRLTNYREDRALRDAGIRTGGNPLAEPKEPTIHTGPRWKVRSMYTYDSYEAK